MVTIKDAGEELRTEIVVQPEESPKEPNWLRGLGIIVALSLHELFGGMAIGLEMSVSTVWFMTGAISVHKLVLAFCIGMEIMMAHTRWLLAVVYLLVFSIVTPIGVGIGIAVSESAAANQPSTVSGILRGWLVAPSSTWSSLKLWPKTMPAYAFYSRRWWDSS